jgi:hypothetical protein
MGSDLKGNSVSLTPIFYMARNRLGREATQGRINMNMIRVPFRPIIEEGEKPFAMLQDLWSKHRDWGFEPIYYSSVDKLIASLDEKIIRPAEARFVELQKAEGGTMGGEHV